MKKNDNIQIDFLKRENKTNRYEQTQEECKQICHEVSQLVNGDSDRLKEAIHMFNVMKHQYLPNENEVKMIKLILDLFSPKGRFYAVICVYQYGVMQGKRRVRMKKKSKNEKKR